MGADNKLLMVNKALQGLGLTGEPEAAEDPELVMTGRPETLRRDRRKAYAMVGDRSFDVNGARANHVTAVGVSYGYGSRRELEEAGADFIADTVEELGRILTAYGD